MWRKIKQLIGVLLIIILLPYVLTVFINGRDIAVNRVEQEQVRVEVDGKTVEMPLEEYCIGVFAKSIEADCEREALKAQAVVVRTQIYREISEGGKDVVLQESFLDKEDMKKAWGSKYTRNYKKMEEVWKETGTEVLTYQGNLATTPYHKLSNGSTRDGNEVLGGDYPYLKIKDCPRDVEAAEEMQTTTIDYVEAKVTSYDSAGYALSVQVGDETCSGEAFRDTYHLPSSCFTLQEYDGKLRIITKGVGHGLGMSQYTANSMAQEGSSYTEILQYFFEGTEIKEVAEILMGLE